MSLFEGRFNFVGWHFLACLCSLILLDNCGFRPLHGKATQININDTIHGFSHVTVAKIPDRAGQIVRNKLLDRLQIYGAADRPILRLEVALKEIREGIAFQQDNRATRFNLHLSAQFHLTNIVTGQSIFKGDARAIAAYNVVRSDYANLTNQRDAQRRAAASVAESIFDRMVIYFSRPKG